MPIFPSWFDQNASPATTDKILVADVSNSNKTEWSEIWNLPVSTATQSAIDSSILSSTLVHTTWNETIDWIKTFSSSPIVPTPTSSTQVATKWYADWLALTAWTGNVVGAASSIDWDIVGFDSTTGKVIKTTGLNQPSSITNTSVSSQWGLLINIDSATGDIAQTASGAIEDEKYWFFAREFAASTSAEFDSAVTRTGRLTLKMSTLDATWVCRVLNQNAPNFTTTATNLANSRFFIPCKPSTKYKFSVYAKTNNAVNCLVDITQVTSAFANLATSSTNTISGTNDWALMTTTFTTNASAVYFGFVFYLPTAWNISDAWFDINSMTLEEVVEPVANSLTLATPSIQSFTAVGSTDNIDQSQLNASNSVSFSNVAQYQAQQIITTKSKFTWVTLYKKTSSWSPTGTMTFSIVNDSAWSPWTTIYATYVMSNATYIALTDNAEFTVNLPCNLTPWTYWNKMSYSVSSATDYPVLGAYNVPASYAWLYKYGTDWVTYGTTFAGDSYFKTLYYKPTTNFKASQNNTSISISADEDGFLDGSVTSLVNGTYSFTKTYAGNETEIAKNYYYSYNVTGQGLLEGVSAWIPINSAFWVNNLVYKVSTILPISNINLILTPQCQPAPRSFKVQYSTDNISYTDLRTYTNADNLAAQTTAIPISGVTVFYLKFVFVASWICYINSLSLSWTLDTSTIPTLYNYPTNKAIRETYTKTLSANTTTAIYRATKYWFPAIEYSNGEYQFLNIDTTATSSVVKFSELWVTYTTVADGGSIALTSTNKPVVYVEVNITANRIYLSSNDYNAISDKDGSNKQTVVYQVKFQWLVDAYNDLKDKLNKIVSYLATL